MKILKKTILGIMSLVAAAAAFSSCSDDKTYAELLTDESHYVNSFLANQRVINEIPEGNKFEVGPDAPYYRLDEDGNLYMQVVDGGTPGDTVQPNELIYYRFTRSNLKTYADGSFSQVEGNDAVLGGNYSFRYGNYELSSSYNGGSGVQQPLAYLPVDCQVNIIIKSQYGAPSEMSSVIPWLYSIRYYRPKF